MSYPDGRIDTPSEDGWEAAKERCGLAQRDRDLALLRKLVDENDGGLYSGERQAFWDMLERLEVEEQSQLTDKQRSWVTETAERLDCADAVESRFTDGPVPRGREVEILVKDKPLRPPTRRASE